MNGLREVITIGALLAILWTPSTSAETLSFSFVDPANDAWGCSSSAGCGIPFPDIVGPATDAVSLTFRFDSATGAYVATMSASAAMPFTGDVVVNVNLFNVNTNVLFTSSNHLFVGTPVTVISVTGTDTKLLTWQAGDQVTACHGPGGIIPETCLGGLGSPPTNFSSGVINFSRYPSTQTARDHFQGAPKPMHCDFSSEPKEPERCFGGIGTRCKGDVPRARFVQHDDSCVVDGWISVGSILHDMCCLATRNAGFSCRGINRGDRKLCKEGWDEAWSNAACILGNRQWQYNFGPYPFGNEGDDTSRRLVAPRGARVNPKYQFACRTSRCQVGANGKTIVRKDLCGKYCICE